jgi:alpha-tubulin suppressor-like RCC1 family protein
VDSYQLTTEDAGQYVTVLVEHSNIGGSATYLVARAIAAHELPSVLIAPSFMSAQTSISGVTRGTTLESVVRLSNGSWTGIPEPTVTAKLLVCAHPVLSIAESMPAGCAEYRATESAFKVELGEDHSCVILATKTMKCWGNGTSGQLGDRTFAASSSPVAVPGIANVVDMALTAQGTCALVQPGSVMCWGSNEEGRIGDGTTIDRSTPTSVTGISNAVSIAAGDSSSCAVLSSGTIKCWGNNGVGQLGDGTTVSRLTPVSVSSISTAVDVATNGSSACALLSSGAVYCWGGNSPSPARVSGISTATSIALGGSHSCALLADGTVKCWGSNILGQLGDGTYSDRLVPTAVIGLSGVTDISSSCAVLANGTVKCWGENPLGLAGNQLSQRRSTPVEISGIATAVDVATGVGPYHNCVVLSGGAMRCWGHTGAGRLGSGGPTDWMLTQQWSSTPGEVIGIDTDWTLNPAIAGQYIVGELTAAHAFGSVTVWSPSTQLME